MNSLKANMNCTFPLLCGQGEAKDLVGVKLFLLQRLTTALHTPSPSCSPSTHNTIIQQNITSLEYFPKKVF